MCLKFQYFIKTKPSLILQIAIHSLPGRAAEARKLSQTSQFMCIQLNLVVLGEVSPWGLKVEDDYYILNWFT